MAAGHGSGYPPKIFVLRRNEEPRIARFARDWVKGKSPDRRFFGLKFTKQPALCELRFVGEPAAIVVADVVVADVVVRGGDTGSQAQAMSGFIRPGAVG